MTDRERGGVGRETKRETLPLLLHSLNGHKGCDRTGSKAGAWSVFQVPHKGAGVHEFGAPFATFSGTLARS